MLFAALHAVQSGNHLPPFVLPDAIRGLGLRQGIGIFLCQRGSGVIALKRTIAIAVLVGGTIAGLQTTAYLWREWSDDIEWGFGLQVRHPS